MSLVTTPTWPDHSPFELSHGNLHIEVKAPTPAFELTTIEEILRGACPIEQDDFAIPLPICQQKISHRPQRRQADPASDDDDVVPQRFLDRPAAAKRATHPTKSPRFKARMALVTVPTARMVCTRMGGATPSPACRISTNGNRHFAHAEDVQHRELGEQGKHRYHWTSSSTMVNVSRVSAHATKTIGLRAHRV